MDICFKSARDLAATIKRGELSAYEVVEAHLDQIERVNPKVNAIVSLVKDRALEEARSADKRFAAGEEVGPLHGLPIAFKDTHATAGIRTTNGSLVLRDNIPEQDELIVERLRKAGAITIGKTNVPEFAAGAHTFNDVFGMTRNPYDLSRTAGGSSGGAAVAVSCGMLPLADGSDMGGSLRFPAAFNNVVGLRTSPGRIPTYPRQAAYSTLSVQGPVARNVADTAFMMSVIAGPDARSPISIEESGTRFLEPLERDLTGLRVAWSPDLGGAVPVDPIVRSVFEQQIKVFEDLGCDVEEASPDFAGAEETFRVLRAWQFEMSYGELVDQYREQIKSSFVWNLEEGRRLSGPDIGRAERLHGALYERMRVFFEQYDVLLLPVSQIPPFDGDLEFPQEIVGNSMETYLDWMRSCYYVSATGHPALSVPGGFTPAGLPLGLQIVGRHRADFEVLQVGYAFEQATGYGKRRPALAKTPEVSS
ncbi:amidase [Bacillus pakistanensis]|uniref:Amidase n=1 Tax=Rossellomorea pakistanensis TaxID=992288 RepID=A0ABS2NBZ5_9BACI|nr:amidase [Bacillus pakistanensis]MBM7585378.1 amidase [Bacillus pakistanensis]